MITAKEAPPYKQYNYNYTCDIASKIRVICLSISQKNTPGSAKPIINPKLAQGRGKIASGHHSSRERKALSCRQVLKDIDC